jgi:nitrogen fixation NifU-like protein
MSDLRELYQETILDHGKRPRHFERMDDAHRSAEGHNPLCGDRITIFVKIDGDRITRVTFQGNGCAISVASASLMAEALTGRRVDEAQRLFAAFHDLVTGGGAPDGAPALGKLEALGGVREFPIRVKCATLAWHTLRAALESDARGSRDRSRGGAASGRRGTADVLRPRDPGQHL